MEIKSFLKNYRGIEYGINIEIRQKNQYIKEERIKSICFIDSIFDDYEIDNWFVKTNSNNEIIIVIDLKNRKEVEKDD